MSKRFKAKVKKDGKSKDHDKPRVQGSLPPDVKGQLRCFLAVTVDQIKWQVDSHPKDIQVCLQWWGETGDGTMFWPFYAKKSSRFPTSINTVLFPVCSGPKQFAAYLKDMSVLVLDVLHSKSLKPFGRVEIHDIVELNGTNPIDKWYPVVSRSVQPVIFADLHVVLRFEPVDVVGQELPTTVPVTDDNFRHHNDNDSNCMPEEDKPQEANEKLRSNEPGNVQKNDNTCNELENQDGNEDVIMSLIKRGKALRNSIVESGDGFKDKEEIENQDLSEEEQLERSVSGSLFKEILKFNEVEDTTLTKPDISSIDLVACDDDIELLYESRSSIGSESDDPMHDETLLQDLFYVNKDDNAIPTLNESRHTSSSDEMEIKESHRKPVDEKENVENHTLVQTKLSDVVEIGSQGPLKTGNDLTSENTDVITDGKRTFSSGNKLSLSGQRLDTDFLHRLGVNKLTVLGRVTAARVHINKLNVFDKFETDKRDKRTYFIEYEFPVAADYGSEQSDKKNVGLEITRIATKKTNAQSIIFNHHSVFPVYFDSTVIRFWCNCVIKISVFERKSGQKSPILIGCGKVDLLSVLTSQQLQYERSVPMKVYSKQDKDGRSSQSSVSSSESPLLGDLEIKVSLMSNGKDLDYFSPEKENASSGMMGHVKNVKDRLPEDIKDPHKVETEQIPPRVDISKKEIPKSDCRHSVPLTTLLWVLEGRNISSSGHGVRVSIPGHITRSNFYLISRMFWTTDTTRSSISWGQHDPKFHFKQIFPVLLTSALLDRMHNNFLTLEVWSKTGGTHEDELIGIAKLPLQQFYLSYKEENTTKALLKSKFPVVGVDGWINIVNPFKGSSHGELHVLLAMGSDNQINKHLDIKQCSDPHDHFKRNERSRNLMNLSSKHSAEKHVEHWFEISVQNVRKLAAFEKTSLDQTDCFVQYNFPYQKPDTEVDMSIDLSQDVPGLQNHRTATTVCVPDTKFNDVARYRILLPPTLPVQRYLLAAYHGSWSGISAAAVVTFELWKRYYYPNIRDQLVAKAVLPLSKLCGMITMQKPGETSIQSFSLPLVTLPNPAENRKSEPGGVLDIIIKYRQSKLAIPQMHRVRENSADVNGQVCLAIEVVRACGLKCALSELAKKYSSLTYASEVGCNPFVKIKLPFKIKMNERTTRTIAKTFCPEFGYRMEFILPLVLRENIIGRDSQEFSGTLAECLEFGEVIFEVWHQIPHENFEVFGEKFPMGQDFYQRQLPPTSDALLGVVKIPMQQLLFSHTGIRGWFPIGSSTLAWSNKDDTRNTLDKTVGGLEIIINLSENAAREQIIESGRAVGWCPPLWYELENGEWLNDTIDNGMVNVGQGLSFLVNVKKVWVPNTLVYAEQTRQGTKGSQPIGCYIRYKFYDTKAVFSSIREVKTIKDSDRSLCDVKHRHSYIVKTTSPLIWYIREERLEIQVWLTGRHRDERTALPHKRDKLLGSAFIPLFPLLDGSKDFSQISGLYPLFRSGAVDLSGAGLHLQLVLQKPSSSNQTLRNEIDEDIASTEPSGSVHHEKESLSIVSSDEEDSKKNEKYKAEEMSSSSEDDLDAAHVVIEQALHLPLVKTHQNISAQPSVYITYKPRSDVGLVKTKTIYSSSSPVWNHEKIVKFKKATISKQMLTFKVWHNRKESVEKSDEDLLLGVASVDLSPLASGLRQVMGWYNIVDFNGQCQGQIKVGVVPLLSISPEKVLFPQINYDHVSTGKKQDMLREQTITRPSKQPDEIESGNLDHFVSTRRSIEVPDSSKSFLLRQLRQNLNDLDAINDKLSQRLTANTLPSCLNKKSAEWLESSEKCNKRQEPHKEDDLEKSLKCLRTSVSNDDDILKWDRNIPVVQDKMLKEFDEDHPDSHVFPMNSARNDSLRRVSSDNHENDSRSNEEYKEVDGDLYNDVYNDVKEYNSDAKCDTTDDDNDDDDGGNNERISIDSSDNDDNGNHDDHKAYEDSDDNDFIGEVELDPSQFINDIINDHINDNLRVVSPNKDVGLDESKNNTSVQKSDNDLTEDKSYGQTDVLSEPQQKSTTLDISPEDTKRSDGHPDDSGDESFDSFFDCVTLKQRSDPKHGVNSPGLNDTVETNSVVSRTNLSKLRNIIHERMSEGEQLAAGLSEHQTNSHEIDTRKFETLNIQRCGPEKDNSDSCATNAVEKTGISQEQLADVAFREHKYGTSLQKGSIPNFFMPPKDLEQSMRSLRLAATFRKQPRQDKDMERTEPMQSFTNRETFSSKGKLPATSFVDWKKLHEIRTTGEVPLTSEETSRLARIFSCNYSTKK